MSHRMDEIKPAHYVTKEECQEMIDDAIRRHNRNAGIISMFVGFFIRTAISIMTEFQALIALFVITAISKLAPCTENKYS